MPFPPGYRTLDRAFQLVFRTLYSTDLRSTRTHTYSYYTRTHSVYTPLLPFRAGEHTPSVKHRSSSINHHRSQSLRPSRSSAPRNSTPHIHPSAQEFGRTDEVYKHRYGFFLNSPSVYRVDKQTTMVGGEPRARSIYCVSTQPPQPAN